MLIPLDTTDPTPLYRQIEAWLRNAIATGALEPGTRLPAARTLATDLGISRTTVEAAYAELLAEGRLETRGSGGTLVAQPFQHPADDRLVEWPSWHGSRVPVPSSRHPGGVLDDRTIDFSGGGGDDSLFPFAGFLKGLKADFGRAPRGFLGLSDLRGEAGLRGAIAGVCASQGLLVSPQGILVTGGSQQAIALASGTLAQAGDAVLVETPTYPKALALFRAQGLRVVGLPSDRQGPIPDEFLRLAAVHRPRFAYLIPNFRNPTGTCMAAVRRRFVVEAADRLGLPILEDDYVGGLRYEGQPLPTLKALGRPGTVIYTGTFSKLLAPGLGIGFLAAEGPILDRLLGWKSVSGLAASRLFQCGLEGFIGVGSYRNHLRKAIRLYRQRRDSLVAALSLHLPQAKFDIPSGGLFVWVRLPCGARDENFAERCAREGVLVTLGDQAFVDPGIDSGDFLRLNFSQVPEDRVDEGVRRLARAVNGPYPRRRPVPGL